MIYFGCDPGKSGAISCLGDNGIIPDSIKLSDSPHNIVRWLKDSVACSNGCRAIIERVNAMPGRDKQGKAVRTMGASTAFTFGYSAGALEMAIAAADIPYKFVTPVKWQTLMKCRTGGDKKISKAAAQRLFPNEKMTLIVADAFLLAELCRTRWDEL